MQLDRTKIAIKQRTWIEIADLSLVVCRDYFRPILFWSLLGAVPFAILNAVLLVPILRYEEIMMQSFSLQSETPLRWRYLALASFLVYMEAPFALQGVTYYLGQAVFVDQPAWRRVMLSLRQSLPRSLLILGVLRLSIFAIPAVLMIPRGVAFSPFIELFVIAMSLFGVSFCIRASRPFAPEIVVLEQCPIRAKKGSDKVATYSLRSKFLHHAVSSDSVSRMILLSLFLGMSYLSIAFCERFVIGVIFGVWEFGIWMEWFLIPINLWILATYATVYRFLSYLDARIRCEGWEVELRFRAEAERMEANA